jgi:hypothetical protein
MLIRIAEESLSELKRLDINDKLIKEYGYMVAISKYLLENTSIDFDNKTIDYYSLFRTLKEISYMIEANSTPSKYSLRLSKRFALLWVYLIQIHRGRCALFLTYIINT